jgi:hypothetical protein
MEREMRLHLGGWYHGVRRLPAGEKGRRHHSGEAVGIVKMERIHRPGNPFPVSNPIVYIYHFSLAKAKTVHLSKHIVHRYLG